MKGTRDSEHAKTEPEKTDKFTPNIWLKLLQVTFKALHNLIIFSLVSTLSPWRTYNSTLHSSHTESFLHAKPEYSYKQIYLFAYALPSA